MNGLQKTLMLLKLAHSPLSAYDDLISYKENVLPIQALGQLLYVIRSPQMARHILKDMEAFPKSDFMQARLRPLLGRGLLTDESEDWQPRRASLNPLFHKKLFDQYEIYIRKKSQNFIERFNTPKVVDFTQEASALTLELIIAILFGLKTSENFEIWNVGRLAEALNHELGRSDIKAAFGMQYKVPKKTKVVIGEWNEQMNALIDLSGAEENSFISDLKNLDTPLSDQEILDEVSTFILAGHETTAMTLAWTMHLLLKHPHVMEQMRAEKDPDFYDAVIKEAMRLYPPSWTLLRQAAQTFEFEKHEFKAKEMIVFPIWTYHRDPEIWEDAQSFKPERFLDKGTDTSAYLPFGFGPRSCIGRGLAMFESRLILEDFLEHLHFEWTDTQIYKPMAKITLRMHKPFRLKISHAQ